MDSRVITVEDTDGTKASAEFQQNQEMVEQLLLDKKFMEKMKNIIREFFAVQRSFHEMIDKFVRAFDSMLAALSEEHQEELQFLLQPYCMLIANPFNDYPSGDVEEDLKHIVSVVNKRNEHFVKILPAISLAALNADKFSKVLAEIKGDANAKEFILQGIKSTSWQDVESRIMLPTQRVMQYRLLLMTIETVIMKAMEEEMQKLGKTNKGSYLELLSPAIAYILPKLNYVNNNDLSKITLLNDIDVLLSELLKMESLKQYEDFTINVQRAKRFLDTVIQKINFNDGSQLDHLRNLKDTLMVIRLHSETTLTAEKQKRDEMTDYEGKQAYYKQGYYLVAKTASSMWYGSQFFPPGQDPREKFLGLMGRLDVEIKDLQIAFDAVSMLMERMGGRSPFLKRL